MPRGTETLTNQELESTIASWQWKSGHPHPREIYVHCENEAEKRRMPDPPINLEKSTRGTMRYVASYLRVGLSCDLP
jgi:hypothetical protein